MPLKSQTKGVLMVLEQGVYVLTSLRFDFDPKTKRL